MLALLQTARARRSGATAWFRHFGAAGLFFLAILDSSPIPTFGGPDILLAILAGSHRDPWYEYVAAATAGSVIGAYLTFRLARRAGAAYLNSKFGRGRGALFINFFHRHGSAALVASTAVPIPFPTALIFAAAGASDYPLRKYVPLVTVCRAARYSAIAIVADLYGRHFIRVLRHPLQYWPWLLLFAALAIGLAATAILVNRKMGTASQAEAAQ